ncbi:MAG: hypothetical protein KME06_16760 [Kastovskya adunca ATA6-11-RM4]|jgi:hypothetical protein|nr:hypothetical protein [Kastovskya adunca ATA6-11-RM4]
MLYFTVAWNFLLIACGLIGTALLNLVPANRFKRVGDRLIAALWLGVVVLSISLLATSLILPLSPVVGAVIAIAFCALSLLSQDTRKEIVALWLMVSPPLVLGFFSLELGVAALTTQQVRWIDTGLYHYGAIRWLADFGAVPGLALLNSQFGFTSSWFAFAAPLNAEVLGDRVSAITNGFALLLALLHFLICLIHSFTNKAQLSDSLVIVASIFILPFLITSELMSVVLVSASPDIVVIFLTVVVSWSILIASDKNVAPLQELKTSVDTKIIPLILSVGAVTIKLTALPILLISSLFYIWGKFSLKRILVGSTIIVLLLLPMFIFGIVSSGCPFFPASFLCVDLPWSLTVQEAQQKAEVTRGWGVWYGSPPPSVIPAVWLFWQWFNSINSNKLITLLILVSIFCAVYVVRKSLITQSYDQLWMLALAVVGTAFMMLQAPLLRFGFGYIVLLPALTTAMYCQNQNSLPKLAHRLTAYYQLRQLRQASAIASLFLIAIIIVISSSDASQAQLILPPKLPSAEVLPKQINNVSYFSPQDRMGICWGAELPCAAQPDEIQLRNPQLGIKAGFVRQKTR